MPARWAAASTRGCARSCWPPWSRSARPDAPLVRKPRLPEARWVEPRIVIRAEFTDWTRDGLLRQAAFKGIELDRDPAHGGAGRGDSGRAGRAEGAIGQPPAQQAPDGEADRAARTCAPRPSKEAWPPAEMDLTPASRAELKALDEMEREGHLDGGRPRGAGHQPGQGPDPGRGRPRRRHQARPAALLRHHRSHHAAAPGRPRAEPAALPRRHRAGWASGRRTCRATRRNG